MKKNKLKIRTNNKGFTLIELIVVLAIMTIITAILAPNFINTVDKARLESDIISASVAQDALELYYAENTKPDNITSADEVVNMLVAEKYLSSSDIQTEDAVWAFDNEHNLIIDISACDENIHEIANTLSEEQKSKLKGI